MVIQQPSGASVYSPKIRDQSVVRKFIGQNSTGYTAIQIFNGSTPVDPDSGTLNLTVWFDDVTAQFPPAQPGVQIASVGPSLITKADTGAYYYELGGANTANRGVLTAQWTYQVNGAPFVYTDFLQILGQMPFYDTLSDPERSIVEQVSFMFGDAFDSTEGGPNLIEPFQTHYDYERIAQMERLAVTRFNFMSTYNNPPSTYGVGPGQMAVPASLSGLMVIGTYLEIVRHLMRSYVEIPTFPNTNVTYVDRTNYLQRWQQVFDEEWPQYVKMVAAAKIGMLNMSRGSLLVAGGIYGGNGGSGLFQAGTYAAQVRSWRFYPAAPAISWGATH